MNATRRFSPLAMSPRTLAAAAALVLLASPGAAQAPAAPGVLLQPHKAVYDLSLASSRGARAIDRATGRITFDFGGAACDGYALQFRQVMRLEGDAGERLADVRSTTFEDGAGRHFTFNTETRLGSTAPETSAGRAERGEQALKVVLRRPVAREVDLPGAAIFPSEHLQRIVEAARRETTVLEARVYDGSQKGEKIYDTTAIIGARRAGGLDAAEPALRKPEFEALARWPVTISYFEAGQGERTPLYTISFELFENGVSRALRLDYGDFVLAGTLTSIETSAPPACRR